MTEEEIDFTDAQILLERAEELIGKKKINLAVPEGDIDYRKLHYKLHLIRCMPVKQKNRVK